jgi:hypothetical protein
MLAYFVLRLAIAATLGYALVLGGLVWWLGLIVAALAALFFVLAPRSGRYLVHSQGGPTPLRRDERSQAIVLRAARNAFAVIVLAVGGLTIAYGSFLKQSVPVNALAAALGLAVSVYALSDIRLRRPYRRGNNQGGKLSAD